MSPLQVHSQGPILSCLMYLLAMKHFLSGPVWSWHILTKTWTIDNEYLITSCWGKRTLSKTHITYFQHYIWTWRRDNNSSICCQFSLLPLGVDVKDTKRKVVPGGWWRDRELFSVTVIWERYTTTTAKLQGDELKAYFHSPAESAFWQKRVI